MDDMENTFQYSFNAAGNRMSPVWQLPKSQLMFEETGGVLCRGCLRFGLSITLAF